MSNSTLHIDGLATTVKYNDIIIVIEVSKVDDSVSDLMNHKHIWGSDDETRTNGIKSIVINLNGEKIDVPQFVFNDLFNPINATWTIERNKNEIILTFSGGDGAGAYTAQLYFEGGIFLRREIHDSIIPEKIVIESAKQLIRNTK